jgi:uncharacterized protein (DUF4415 family)
MKPKPISKPFKSDMARLRALPDDAVNTSEIPPLSGAFFRRAKLRLPEPKEPVSLRLDKDLLAWFKRQGRGYQTRINAVLRLYAQEHGLKPGAK